MNEGRASSSVRRERVVILAAGRSGSTLLQSAFLAACNTITFFEPCRHSPSGDVRKAQCVDHVLRFLNCRMPMKRGRWDPPLIRGWMQHPYREANTSCKPPPFHSVKRTRQRCRLSPFRLVKEIRLVGELALLASALQRDAMRRSAPPAAIIHLVRDPRALLASFKKLSWWELNKGGQDAFGKVAGTICRGMLLDAAAGAALNASGNVLYLQVRFEELVAHMPDVIDKLYTDLGWPHSRSVDTLVSRVVRGECRQVGELGSHTPNPEYGTCRNATVRRLVNRRWVHELTPAEQKATERLCGDALDHFRYAHRS
jgi:hypothetical protein